MKVLRVGLAAGLLLLCGCDQVTGADTGCDGASARELLETLIKDRIEDFARSTELEDGNGTPLISKSKLRASLNEIKFALEDVRTTKEDPNSTQRFCTGKLSLTFPDEVLGEANDANEMIDYMSVQQLADQNDLDRSGRTFSSDIDYSVQPTDDKTKIYLELDGENKLVPFASNVMASYLLHSRIEAETTQQRLANERLEKEQEQALTEQRKAAQQEAKIEFELSTQALNATWQAVPEYTRSELLELQRAWVRRKTADCRVEAAGYSTDDSEKETSRLQCETRMNGERQQWLQRYLEY